MAEFRMFSFISNSFGVGKAGQHSRLRATSIKPRHRSSWLVCKGSTSGTNLIVNSKDRIQPGHVVTFQLVRNERRLGFVLKKGAKSGWDIADDNGSRFLVQEKQILFCDRESGVDDVSDLHNFVSEVNQLADRAATDLEALWKTAIENNASYSTLELANQLFPVVSSKEIHVCLALIRDENVYFKKQSAKGAPVFVPRKENQVREMKLVRKQAKVHTESRDARLARIQKAIDKGDQSLLKPSDSGIIRALEELAVNLGSRVAGKSLKEIRQNIKEGQDEVDGKEILTRMDLPPVSAGAFQAMVRLGRFTPNENLHLRRSPLFPPEFDSAIIKHSQKFDGQDVKDLDEEGRMDFTSMGVYGVDSDQTVEVDDAIGLERDDTGKVVRLWVHIADPTRWVQFSDVLVGEALRRSCSVYLPTGPIPMFPLEIVRQKFSLTSTSPCCALSIGFRFNSDGSIADDFQIVPSKVIARQITYDYVDKVLNSTLEGIDENIQKDFHDLDEFCQKRRAHRIDCGAFTSNLPETLIKVVGAETRDPTVEISVVKMDTRAWNIVEEMMLSAGEVVGRFCRDREIPIPFRTQPPPNLPDEEDLQSRKVQNAFEERVAMLRLMCPSQTEVVPGAHSGIGVEVYSQVTSPLRRSTDLLAHYQLKAFLRDGSILFNQREMKQMLNQLSTKMKTLRGVENKTKRYWLFEKLRQNELGEKKLYVASVLSHRSDDKLVVRILLEEYMVQITARSKYALPAGQRVLVEVINVQPHMNSLRGYVRKRLGGESYNAEDSMSSVSSSDDESS